MTATRGLAVILDADVPGYSRLMGEDEAATLRLRHSPVCCGMNLRMHVIGRAVCRGRGMNTRQRDVARGLARHVHASEASRVGDRSCRTGSPAARGA
jgi:hypothetical protein